jgi:hypothetical protein
VSVRNRSGIKYLKLPENGRRATGLHLRNERANVLDRGVFG